MDEDDIMPVSEGEDLEDENEDFIENPDIDAAPETEDAQENEGEEGNDSTQKKPAKKRVVLNPRPKLDAQRLSGKRGIPILPKIFEDKKFKGKGHEKEDLNLLMSTLEHWGHRLFPLMTFDTLLAAIEKLGTKKAVQVTIKKMRLDMPILDDDFVTQRDDDDDDNNPGTSNQNGASNDPDQSEPADAFEELLRSNPRNSYRDDPLQEPMPHSSQTPKEKPKITEEMRERMEHNKRIALEKRRQKQNHMKSMDTSDNNSLMQDVASISRHSKDVGQDGSTNLSSDMNETEVNMGGSHLSQEASSTKKRSRETSTSRKEEENSTLGEASTSSGVTLSASKEQATKTAPFVDLLDEDEFLEEMWGEDF